MPRWAGYWKGGRYYLDDQGRPVYFIERRKRVIRLATHDQELALGELARFWSAPESYQVERPAPPAPELEPLYITAARVDDFLESIRGAVKDHRRARASQLKGWAKLKLDLRTASPRALRAALATFSGGHRGRVEALNAFARFLVREGELASWTPLQNTREPKATRAARVAYTVEQIRAAYAKLDAGPVRDLFRVRVETGMHHTEIRQVLGLAVSDAPLPDTGAALRQLPMHEHFLGVVQVVHRKKAKKLHERRHRISLGRGTWSALLRLRAHVPDRVTTWEKLGEVGIVPSNLRHTYTTLAVEVGRLVTYTAGGVDRAQVAQVLGHRAGSAMTADRYDRSQVPPLILLPLDLGD